MIVAMFRYTADAAVIDRLRPAHVDWLKAGLAEGRVRMAGRKVPLDGGMFLAGGSLDSVQAWAATDPYALEAAVAYDFTEIAPTMVAPGLEALGQ